MKTETKDNIKNWLIIIGWILLILVCLYIALALVPTMVELAVANNWNGLGTNNRWFYFFYFLTLGVIGGSGTGVYKSLD